MQRKMTISLDEDVYRGLLSTVGKRKISKFISDTVRPHVVESYLEEGYKAMVADEDYQFEAKEWVNTHLGEGGYTQ